MTIDLLLQQPGRALVRALGIKALDRLGLHQRMFPAEKLRRPLMMNDANQFAEFMTDDGRRISLYEGYRDRIKSRWRSDHWATIALLNIKGRVQLPSGTATLVKNLLSGRTLPASLEEFADAVTEIAQQYPHELSQSSILCPLTQRAVIAARLTEEQADSITQSYQRNASSKLRTYVLHTGKQVTENITTLEVGWGMR